MLHQHQEFGIGQLFVGLLQQLCRQTEFADIMNETGKANGVYIDGRDNPGLRQVVVAGFTIQNAKFEGILVTNASSVTISDNRVDSNDLALNPSPPPT